MVSKGKNLVVEGINISLYSNNEQDYISLTDMVKDSEDGARLVEKWLSNKNTIEFLGIWEQLNNPNFNSPEFGEIRNEAGTNRFYLSAKRWIASTNAIGLVAKAGRYGGTYAHKDIAFNFGLYISPMFNLLLIKEYQRLKEAESNQYSLEWNVKRMLSKNNYQVHTDAVKDYVLPQSRLGKDKQGLVYAEEADIINLALFGCSAKEWRQANPQKALAGENIRDMASINELIVLSNLEQANAIFIKDGKSKEERLPLLSQIAKEQLTNLDKVDVMKSIKRLSPSTYLDTLGSKES